MNDPRGAALELWVGDEVDLTKYLGVHFIKENLKKKEKAVANNNDFEDVYEVGCWKYGEEAARLTILVMLHLTTGMVTGILG